MAEYTQKIQVAPNKYRTYYVHTPPNYTNSVKWPVVIGLHGGGANSSLHRQQTKMDEKADALGFISAYIDGSGSPFTPTILTWNAETCCGYSLDNNVDDAGLITKVIDGMKSKWSIDRVFLNGFSNGGMMAYTYAKRRPDKINGIGIVGADMGIIPDNPQDIEVPVINFQGLKDPAVKFMGGESINMIGGKPVYHNPIPDVINYWIITNDCFALPYVEFNVDYIKFTYKTNLGKPHVVLYVLPEGGHTWPGGTPMNQAPGPLVENVDASALMLEYFKTL